MLNRAHCHRALFKICHNAHKHTSSQNLANFTEGSVDLNYVWYKSKHRSPHSPVIILHGLLSSKNSWKSVSETIHQTTGREVIAVDARNHGNSPHCPKNTYIHMAYDMLKLIRKLRLPKVTLLGQSMGGRTAMVLSLLHPDLISSLMLVDISPVSMSQQLTNNFPRVLDSINAIDFKGVITENEAIGFARDAMHASGITHKETVDFILKNIGVKNDKTVGWLANVKVLREYFPTLLKFPNMPGKVFSGPTLFLRAGQSDFLQVEDLPRIRDYFPRAELEHVPHVGHNVQEEDPTALLKLIVEFLHKTI